MFIALSLSGHVTLTLFFDIYNKIDEVTLQPGNTPTWMTIGAIHLGTAWIDPAVSITIDTALHPEWEVPGFRAWIWSLPSGLNGFEGELTCVVGGGYCPDVTQTPYSSPSMLCTRQRLRRGLSPPISSCWPVVPTYPE